MLRRALIVLVAAAALVAAGCGSDAPPPDASSVTLGDATTGTTSAATDTTAGTQAPPPPPGTVEIVDFRFVPTDLTVARGETVTWRNDDPYDHWVVSTQPDVLDSGQLSQAQTYTKTFSQAGTYEYYCNIHNYMKAEVTVR